MECRICKKDFSLNFIRLGVCWNCAEAESIIEDGTDMNDTKLAGTSMEKLQALIDKGWNYPNSPHYTD